MAKMTKAERAVVTANEEYLKARLVCVMTAGDEGSEGKDGEYARAALPGLRRSARAAWNRLVAASELLTPASRSIYAWALHADGFSIETIYG